MRFTDPLARLISIAFLAIPLSASAQEIAITLDDLPYIPASRTSPAEGLQIVQSVTKALRFHNITATGFVIGQQLKRKTIPALQAFAEAGHTIGNHSWSHPDYGTLTPKEFRAETRRTHKTLAKWIGTARYYRFPFLKEGETEATKAAATEVLTSLGYQNIPVSIDTDDWRFNRDYLDALKAGNNTKAAQIATDYLTHMHAQTAHFQALAQTALGRDVKHILLLHMNRINADHLATLLDWYAAQGWRFITVDQAMRDPLYSAPDIYAGPRGLSQIERIMGRKSQ